MSGEEEPVVVSGNRIGDGASKIGSGTGGGGVTDVADMANMRVPTFDSIVSVPANVPADVGVKVTPVAQFPRGAANHGVSSGFP